MHESLKRLVSEHTEVFIDQIKEWAEILISFEGKNKYRVTTKDNEQLGFVFESSGGFFSFIARQLCGSHRPMEITCLDGEQQPMMIMKRPFFFFFSEMTVMSQGKLLGFVHRRFGIFYKKYTLCDHSGNSFAHISSPVWRLWTFKIYNLSDQEIGVITKRWGGVLKELFTDADRFGVQFSKSLSEKQNAIVFAAALSIDMDFFDNNQK